MRICLYLDPSRVMRWHLWLAQALTERPDWTVSLRFAATSHPLPRSCMLALALERAIYGLWESAATDRLDIATHIFPTVDSHGGGASVDVLIDLAGHGDQLPTCKRVLTPLFNAVPGEIGAIAALLEEVPIRITIHDTARPGAFLNARPGLADRRVLASALDNVLSRGAELIIKALREPTATNDVADARSAAWSGKPVTPATPAAIAHVAAVVTQKMIALIGRTAAGGHRWAVAWRFHGNASLLDDGQAGLSVLPDDGRRYYADPFPFYREGRHFIFVEEVPFATGRGCISVATVGADGSIAPPRPIIEESHHLSFPFVFEHDGCIWMIPESGDANRIDLYRAEDFPDRWTRVGPLIDGLAGYDATLFRHQGCFWLFLSLRQWKSTTWDNLSLFHGAQLAGPWLPHPDNPVVLDAMWSRPAGALFRHDGEIVRPTQDCSQIYGGAIALCRLDVLTGDRFAQTPIGRIKCETLGCHTYNRAAGLEVLDVFGPTNTERHVTAHYTSAL
jgi:hypothetical protein